MNKYRVMFTMNVIVSGETGFDAVEKACKERGWSFEPFTSDVSGGSKWVSCYIKSDDTRYDGSFIDAIIVE